MGVTSVVKFRCICDKCKKEKCLDSQPITIKRRSDAAPEYYCEKCLPEVLGLNEKRDTEFKTKWQIIEVYNNGDTCITSKSEKEMIDIFEHGGDLLPVQKINSRDIVHFTIELDTHIQREFKKKFEAIKYKCFGNIVLNNPDYNSRLKKIICIKYLDYKEKRYGK
jgi:hypothetical protein